jgi:hypothetical protein
VGDSHVREPIAPRLFFESWEYPIEIPHPVSVIWCFYPDMTTVLKDSTWLIAARVRSRSIPSAGISFLSPRMQNGWQEQTTGERGSP